LYHEPKADHAESKTPVESFSWSLSQSSLEHPRTNWVAHLVVVAFFFSKTTLSGFEEN